MANRNVVCSKKYGRRMNKPFRHGMATHLTGDNPHRVLVVLPSGRNLRFNALDG
jgi:hypothetical protein